MKRYGPDGRIHDFPEDATEAEIQTYFAKLRPSQPVPTPVEKAKGRAVAQGITFWFR